MNERINPFNEVYKTESISAEKFVDLFSPLLVENTLALYQPGHIILKGLIGTGKSMLLNLLKPEVRISYFKAQKKFPIPEPYQKFVTAGINFRRSGIIDFGQRPIVTAGFNKEEISPIFFGDFLNYWIVADILESIRRLSEYPGLSEQIGIEFIKINLDKFAVKLAAEDCWMGYLNHVDDYESLIHSLNNRITKYRAYLNFNLLELPDNIGHTKSIVGIPITKLVYHLKQHRIVKDSVEFYVRLDQYEDLERIYGFEDNIGKLYQEIIHKLLGMRDTSVSYKIGTRDFAWDKERKRLFGTQAFLERKRDYNEIDLNDILRRNEDRKTWIFPKFAEDIFVRRLKEYYNFENKKDILKYVFGSSLKPIERVKNYYIRSDTSLKNAIKIDKEWPIEWQDFLSELLEKDIIEARFAEAWSRQKGEKGNIVFNIPEKKPYPWDKKVWWRKERIEQALMQIASRNRQKLHWSGKEDIISLSGGNILAFIHQCKYIWNVWLRDIKNINITEELPQIPPDVQSLGIIEASYSWFEDIKTEKGGDKRLKFIRFLGNFFYDKLTADLPMSYPGHNGFSLEFDELESNNLIRTFLNEASDFGDLYRKIHTSRSKGQGKRVKWYLSPILSPYFKIPSKQTKEPYYVSNQVILEWLEKSESFTKKEIIEINKKNNPQQTKLPF